MANDAQWSEMESPFIDLAGGDSPGPAPRPPLSFESPPRPALGLPPGVTPDWRNHYAPVSPLAAAAAAVARNPAIALYTTTKTPGIGADPASNIRDTAAGLQATLSSGPQLPGGTVNLDLGMLNALNALTRAPYSYTFRVTALAGGKHEVGSRHYVGTAVDIDMINGVAVDQNHPKYKEFMRACQDLGATTVLGPPTECHEHHVHAAWPRPVVPKGEFEASSCEVPRIPEGEFESAGEIEAETGAGSVQQAGECWWSLGETPTLLSTAELQPGDVIVSTTTQLLSQVIRKSQGDIVSHSIVYIGDGQVVEMIWPKAIRRTVANAIAQSSYAFVLRYPGLGWERQSVITGFALKTWKEGRKFDFWGMVRTGFGAKKSGDRRFFCSELVLKAYREAGIKLFDRKLPTPGDLHELCGTILQYVGHLKVDPTAHELEMSLLRGQDDVDLGESYQPEVELYDGPGRSTLHWEFPAVSAEDPTTAAPPIHEYQAPENLCGQVGEYIGLVRKVEAANPTWSAEDVLNALRGLAATDNWQFRALFGTEPGRRIVPVVPYPTAILTTDDIAKLERMSCHKIKDGVQWGNAKDALGYDVSLGHVLSGLSAGQHRNRNTNLATRLAGFDSTLRIAYQLVDNLYAATISGDLGQSAANATHVGGRATVGAGSAEASDAELVGDLDGFLLGHAGGLGGRRLSDVLYAYYCVDACAPAGSNAARRFSNFGRLGMAGLLDQTLRFAINYFAFTAFRQRSLSTNVTPQVTSIFGAFSAWLMRMASKEANACASLRRGGGAGQLFEGEQESADSYAAEVSRSGACPTCSRAKQTVGAALAPWHSEDRAQEFDVPDQARLSGGAWWDRNQSRYPYSTSIDALEATFRVNVKAFVAALETAGAAITVITTTRSPERAYLMHYAWEIATGIILAPAVPAHAGVDIVWDHNDDSKSKKAAADMVARFGMGAAAVLDTEHAPGRAIDMKIKWSGTIKVKKKDGTIVDVTFMDDADKNTTLHDVGKSYGVIKLLHKKDPAHWSVDGS